MGAREADTAASPKAKVSVRSVVLSFPSAVSNVLAMSRGVAQAKVATPSTPMRTSRWSAPNRLHPLRLKWLKVATRACFVVLYMSN